MAKQIFISYRRDDSAPWAGRLYDRLALDFRKDSLFIDVDSIAPGQNFVKVLDEQVGRCDAFLCIIGKNWLHATNQAGARRLDDPNDFVRIEVESALKRPATRVIPILVDGASMPRAEDLPDTMRELAQRNALELTHARFGADTKLLVEALSPGSQWNDYGGTVVNAASRVVAPTLQIVGVAVGSIMFFMVLTGIGNIAYPEAASDTNLNWLRGKKELLILFQGFVGFVLAASVFKRTYAGASLGLVSIWLLLFGFVELGENFWNVRENDAAMIGTPLFIVTSGLWLWYWLRSRAVK